MLKGDLGLHLRVAESIYLDGGVWNFTAPNRNITVSAAPYSALVEATAAACDGKTYQSARKGILGGFDGGYATGYDGDTTIRHAHSTPGSTQAQINSAGGDRSDGSFCWPW